MIRGARPPRALREAQDERREAVAAHHDLLRKQRLRALSADERARMAWHAAMLADDVDGAMKLLQENLRDHPGHVPSLCELATLLQRQNARPDAAPDANTTRGPDDARREPAQDAAEALWREAAAQPGPHRLACLRQLTAIALRRGDAGQALAWRTEADQWNAGPWLNTPPHPATSRTAWASPNCAGWRTCWTRSCWPPPAHGCCATPPAGIMCCWCWRASPGYCAPWAR